MSDKKFPWVSTICAVIIVLLFAISFNLGSKTVSEGEEGFGGTDSAVVDIMDEQGAKPWFSPIFEPSSGELESGLFALQAAVGAGIVGFAFGNLRGRQVARDEQRKADKATDADAL